MIDLNQTIYKQAAGAKFWIDPAKLGNFGYNDGDDVEQRILTHISKCEDKSVFSTELAQGIADWPSLYHLSSRRANLLRPIIDLLGPDVLEVGAGCGAITRFLGEAGKNVLAVEGSHRRAMIAAERCHDLPNVQVLAASFSDIDLDQHFDTVVFVGVLEYSRQYFKTQGDRDPVDATLLHAQSLLKPGGRLIIAIENQLGLKYFAGYKEDHAGEAFFGIEDKYSVDGVVTFGRKELLRRIKQAGFTHHQWWFPLPDYKLPISVISEEALDEVLQFDAASLCARSVVEDFQRPTTTLFSLQESWKPICRNGLFPELANSFLLVSSKEQIPANNTVAYHFGTERRKDFAKVVKFQRNGDKLVATRQFLNQAAQRSTGTGVSYVLENEHHVPGDLWQDRLSAIVNQPRWTLDDVVVWADVWWTEVLNQAGYLERRDELTSHTPLDGRFIDAIPRNMVVQHRRCTFIDQEWSVPAPVEAGYLLYRGLSIAFSTLETCEEPAATVVLTCDQLVLEIAYRLNLWLARADIRRFKDLESQFQERATGLAAHYAPHVFGSQTLPIKLKLERVSAMHEELVKGKSDLAERERDIGALAEDLAAAKGRLADIESTTHSSLVQREIDELHLKIRQLRQYHENLIRQLAATLGSGKSQIDSETGQLELNDVLRAAFSERWYLEQYPDVAEAGANALDHYLQHGAAEGRAPHPMW